MLQITDLSYRYPDSAVIRVAAFSLATGEHGVLVGPSGCGKSTILHLLAGILTPQHGLIEVAGTNLKNLSGRAGDRWRGAQVGFLPQKLALVPSLTVRENLLLASYAAGKKPDAGCADDLLHALGLLEKADAKPARLSQGQQQRVAIARALFNRPRLLLADEPTANLDDEACRAALDLLRTQASAIGASLVITTHDARVLAALPQAKVLQLRAANAQHASPVTNAVLT